MSLDWKLTDIKDYKELCWREDPDDSELRILNPVTKALIFRTMSVGMGDITEKNWKDFYERLYFLQLLDGPEITGTDSEGEIVQRSITPEEVHRHVGLHTNVWPKEGAAAWRNRMWKGTQRESRRRIREYTGETY